MGDFPFAEAEKFEEPEHYRTARAAAQAHELIESLTRPQKREAPVEVAQAHRIGSLESDVRHLERECEAQSRRVDGLESELTEMTALKEQYQTEYNQWRSRALQAEREREQYKELHSKLLAKRRSTK